MTKLSEVRWGIIGVGDVCEIKSGPAFQNIRNSKLVAVMRRDGQKAKDYAERHGVPKWYDDASALINDKEVNAIYIATPPEAHMDYTRLVAESQKPVYVEKPMARNYDECKQMVAACEKHQVPLFVAYYRRSMPNFLKVKHILEEETIGDIRYANVKLNQSIAPDVLATVVKSDNWRVDPAISGGGYFYDLASHQLDFLDYLLGPVQMATGYAKNQAGVYEAEDITVGSFYFESGVLGQGVWCFSTGDSSEEELITIVGSKGQVSFSCFGDHSVSLKVDGQPSQQFNFEISPHIQQYLIQTIVDQLTGEGQCPSTGQSAARTSWVMDQICKRVDLN